jgi:hypothetical protein
MDTDLREDAINLLNKDYGDDCSFRDMISAAWLVAEVQGFHTQLDRDQTMIRIALVGTEVSEALQEIKRHGMDGIEACLGELADVQIRLADLVGMLGAAAQFPRIVREKQLANLQRPSKYGTPDAGK